MSHKKFMEKFKETISKKHNDVVERDLIQEEMIKNLNLLSEAMANRKSKEQEVQAIIDILSDPLILRHRGLK